MEKIDVLIPHYNDLEGLYISLLSVARQSWGGPLRVVVADDGSSEEIREALPRILALFDLEIELVAFNCNRGRPHVRNLLLDNIKNDFVAWLDAGDEWYDEKLSFQMQQLKFLEAINPHLMYFITCNYDWQRTGGKRRLVKQKVSGDQVRSLLVGQSLRAYLWSILARADVFKKVGEFDTKLPRLQDLDYFIRFSLKGGRIETARTSNSLCVYHKSDVGRDANEIYQCNQYILKKHGVVFERYGNSFVAMREYNMALHSARFAYNNHDVTLGRRFMYSAFMKRPLAFLKRLPKHGLKP